MNGNSFRKRVESMASLTYNELEKVIEKHGHDSFKDLILILIEIFESLDASYRNEEELIEDNKNLVENNEKLIMQFERERFLRKELESKLFVSEELFEDQKKDYEEKIQSLENVATKLRKLSENKTEEVNELLDVISDDIAKQKEVKKCADCTNSSSDDKFEISDLSEVFETKKTKNKKPKTKMKFSKSFCHTSSFYELGHLLLENSNNTNMDANNNTEISKKKKFKKSNESKELVVSIEELDRLSKERNKYKEELIDLRETVSLVETIRALKFDLTGESNTQFTNNSTIISYLSEQDDYSVSKANITFNDSQNNSESDISMSCIEFEDDPEYRLFLQTEYSKTIQEKSSRNPFKFAKRFLNKSFIPLNGWRSR